MKKLISMLMAMCMLLSCAAASAYAEEKKDDYSSLFFEHMKNYTKESIAENIYNEGLVDYTYRLLGDTSNGFHIAYCKYYWGDNYDESALKWTGRAKYGDYLLIGDAHRNCPYSFGVYCFDNEACVGIEDVFYVHNVSSEHTEPWIKTVPLDEVVKILNDTDKLHVYYKSDLPEESPLSAFFKDETILPFFREYAGSIAEDIEAGYDCNCSVYGKHDKYYIFHGRFPLHLPMVISKVVDGYVVTSSNIYGPYDLGIFAFDGENIYTLEEAIDKKLFKMSDIADMIDAKPVIMGEVTGDGKVDMEDVIFLQRHLACLFPHTTANQSEYNKFSADIDKNGEINMYDVVLIQRMIAKL